MKGEARVSNSRGWLVNVWLGWNQYLDSSGDAESLRGRTVLCSAPNQS